MGTKISELHDQLNTFNTSLLLVGKQFAIAKTDLTKIQTWVLCSTTVSKAPPLQQHYTSGSAGVMEVLGYCCKGLMFGCRQITKLKKLQNVYTILPMCGKRSMLLTWVYVYYWEFTCPLLAYIYNPRCFLVLENWNVSIKFNTSAYIIMCVWVPDMIFYSMRQPMPICSCTADVSGLFSLYFHAWDYDLKFIRIRHLISCILCGTDMF